MVVVATPERLAKVAAALIGDEVGEVVVIAVFINARNKATGYAEVSRGGLEGATIDVGSVLRMVLLSGQPAFALAHNHTSGESQPSRDDIEFTRALERGAKAVGLRFLDHVVVTGVGKHTSLAERGLMNDY